MDHREIIECRKILDEKYDHQAIQKARKLLGKDYDHISNEQIENIVKRLKVLAKISVGIAIRDISEEKEQN